MDQKTKSIIDRIWTNFWEGGVTNPLTVIEQITYLLFIKGLDDIDILNERNDNLIGMKRKRIFDEDHQYCRWSIFKNYSAEKMYDIVKDSVFPFIKSLSNNKNSGYAKYMEDAIFIIPTPIMLQRVVTSIDRLEMKDRDTKGDVYEYLLSKLSTAGTNGQFRTPRHIKKPTIELFISKERYEEIREKYGVPKKGDVLITAVGTIGVIWVVDTSEPFYYKDGNLLQVRLNENISHIYFKYVLNKLINIFKNKNVSGSAYLALTIEKFKHMKIILPPIELQNEFENIVKKIEKQNSIIKKNLEEMENLKKSLMNKYFR